MIKKIILLFAYVVLSTAAFAQHTNILIQQDDGSIGPDEPSIIINPKNTNQLIAAANIDRYYYSTNAGVTWQADTLHSIYGVYGDPCVTVDTLGRFYFFHLANPPLGQGSWIDRIVCQRIDTLDHSWVVDSYMGKNGTKAQDKEWAIVCPKTNAIYTTWTQFDNYGSSSSLDSTLILFSKSTNGGQTWSFPKRISKKAGDCIDSDNTVEGAVPAVGPSGEVYVSWAGPLGIMFDRSTDKGDTWLNNDIFVDSMPGGWDMAISGISRCNGMPITACDVSNSPYRGTIYINWCDQRNGVNNTDVWISKSTDGGDTWTLAKKVNDDATTRQQFFTWMAVDQSNGYIYIVFYDRRNYNDNRTDVYMAVSKDGGEAFKNFKVSETPFIPTASVFFGDYNNISAHNGIIRPIWTRMENGQKSIWTAIVDTVLLDIHYENKLPLNLDQNNPNPFKETTYFSYKIFRPSQVSLRVLDVYGRQVAMLINKKEMMPGKYVECFDATQHHLSAGVYYFLLTCNGSNLTRKMILIE